MAFGLTRNELKQWKEDVLEAKIAFLTHYWLDERFPNCFTVTKVGCADIEKLINWGEQYGLKKQWIDYNEHYPHFDLFGEKQLEVLRKENRTDHIKRFKLTENNKKTGL